MTVSVVILNWNGKQFLEDYLPSVIEHSFGHQIVVIDNASTDDSIVYLQENWPLVKIIGLKENHGYTGGYNIGIEELESDICILLNSDIEVTPNWIEPIKTLFENDASIAACQPKILSIKDKSKFEYAGAGGGFIDKYGYPFCRGRIFDTLETDNGQYDDNEEIFWASGACMFVRREAFVDVGGLDNVFFAHMEEIDLCWRMKNMGHRIFYCGNSTVYHVGGGTLSRANPNKTFLNFRNNLLMVHKNMPMNKVLSTIIVRLFLDGIASFNFLFSAGIGDFFAVMRAHYSFYRLVHQNRSKRIIHTSKGISKMYKHNIVVEYFWRKKRLYSDLAQNDFTT